MKRALINIDYTYDFVAEKGALTCGKPGQEIENEIVHITKQYIENGDYVVFAIDKHEENDEYHPEAKLFPPHNIAGTMVETYSVSYKKYTKHIKMLRMYIIWIKRDTVRLLERI